MRSVQDCQVRIAFVNEHYEKEAGTLMPTPKIAARPGYPSMHQFYKDMAKEWHVGLGVLCFQLLYDYYLISTGQPNRGLWQTLIETTIEKTLEKRGQEIFYPLPKEKEGPEQKRSGHSLKPKQVQNKQKEGPTQL